MFGTVTWGSLDDQTAKVVRELMDSDKFMGSLHLLGNLPEERGSKIE